MRVLLLLIVLAVPAYGDEAGDLGALTAPRPIVSEIVDLTSANQQSFVGAVAARTEADLGFPVIGTVAGRPVEVGDLVHAGDVIAQLNPEDLDADLRAAEAGVLVATAQFRSAEDARARARDLVARGVDTSTRLEDASRQLIAAQARLDQAEAAQLRAEDIRRYATLTAPQDGIIVAVYAERGATLNAGEAIVRLAGTAAREIVFDLTEQDIAGLDVGATFNARLAAASEVTAVATLYRIDPVAERTTRTRRLHLTLNDPPSGFRLGALAQVSLTASSAVSLSIPRSAILNIETSPSVWIIDRATNTVSPRQIALGAEFGTRVRIVDGLSAGDEVVLKGIHSLKDGQTVGPRVMP
jgi:RND family efflux transporter MFP subunit